MTNNCYNINYRMLPGQAKFFYSQVPFTLFTGGYGSGKTYGLCMKALLLSQQNAPVTVGLICPNLPMMKRDVIPVLKSEILEKFDIPYHYHQTEHWFRFPLWNGHIQIVSADQPETLKGPSWAAVGFNEPGIMKHEAYLVGISRARHPEAAVNQIFLAGTPEGFNWLYDEFIATERSDHEVIYAPTTENIFLPDFYVERLRQNYDARLARMYIDGHFVNVWAGQVYYAFDRRVHIDKHLRISPLLPLCWTWDFNLNPMSSLLIQHHQGEVRVVDEIVIKESSNTYEVIEEFRRRDYHLHPAGVVIYGDAYGHSGTTTSDYQVIRQAGFNDIRVPRNNPPVRARVNAANARLRNSKDEVSLSISSRCRELVKDLEQVVYKQGSAEIDKSDPQRTHTSDALGYFIHSEYPIRQSTKWFNY